MTPGPEELRAIAALLIAVGASLFWVGAIMQALMGDEGQSLLSRTAAAGTALASSVMLAQIAYAFSCATCHS